MSVEDRAQELELQEWVRNNKVRTTKQYKLGEEGYGPEECEECEAVMPELRRIDGRHYCTTCQTAIERQQRRLLN